MGSKRVGQRRRVRVSLRAVMFTIVSALVVAPFTGAWADNPTDTSTTTPELETTTPPTDPASPETTPPATAESTTPATDAETTTTATASETTTAHNRHDRPPDDRRAHSVGDGCADATPTADDGDGVAATIEDAAPNGGDGNRDGLDDSRPVERRVAAGGRRRERQRRARRLRHDRRRPRARRSRMCAHCRFRATTRRPRG